MGLIKKAALGVCDIAADLLMQGASSAVNRQRDAGMISTEEWREKRSRISAQKDRCEDARRRRR